MKAEITKEGDLLCRMASGGAWTDQDGITWCFSWPFAKITVFTNRMEVRLLKERHSIEIADLTQVSFKEAIWPFPASSLNFCYKASKQPRIDKLFFVETAGQGAEVSANSASLADHGFACQRSRSLTGRIKPSTARDL